MILHQNLQCIIGPEQVINELSNRWIHAHKLKLKAGFSVIPLNTDLICDMEELADKGEHMTHEEFNRLSASVEDVLKEISYSGPIGYFETNYHHGEGTQAAIGYLKGKIIEGPCLTENTWGTQNSEHDSRDAINAILYQIGLKERSDIEGFELLGLNRFKSNQEILNS